jgi:glycosyltransferase 2 family protein
VIEARTEQQQVNDIRGVLPAGVDPADCEAGGATPRVSRKSIALKIIVSAGVLALLAYIIDWSEFARVAAGARVDILLLAGALLFLGNLMIAWRWKVLLAPVGIDATFMQAFRSYLKGYFVGYFVPSGVTADVVRAVDMHRARTRAGAPRGIELVASIFIERGFGAITVGIAVVLGLTMSPLVGEHADLQTVIMLAAGAVIVCCVLALFADQLHVLIPRWALRRWSKLGGLVQRARDSFAAYRSSPASLVLVMLLSVAVQALRIVPVYVIGLAIGAGSDFFPYMIAVPIVFLSNMIPVIGSRVGTEQGLFVLLLGLAGISAESALVIALASLVLNVIMALPGGYWLIRGDNVKAGARPG